MQNSSLPMDMVVDTALELFPGSCCLSLSLRFSLSIYIFGREKKVERMGFDILVASEKTLLTWILPLHHPTSSWPRKPSLHFRPFSRPNLLTFLYHYNFIENENGVMLYHDYFFSFSFGSCRLRSNSLALLLSTS